MRTVCRYQTMFYIRFVKNVLALVFCACIPVSVEAQSQRDSLDAVIRSLHSRTDKEAALMLADAADVYSEFDSHTAWKVAARAEALMAESALTPSRIYVLTVLANVCRKDNRYAESAQSYQRVIAIAESINAFNEKAHALTEYGWLLLEQGKLDKALEQLQEAQKIAQGTGSTYEAGYTLMRLAGLYHSTKNLSRADSLYSEALRYCQKGLKSASGTQRRLYDGLQATIYNNRGVLYQDMKEHERAMQSFLLSLDSERRIGRMRSIGRVYNNIGETFTARQQFDSALAYQHQALLLYQQTEYDAGLANLLGNIAWTQNSMGRFHDAITSAKKSLEYCEAGDLKEEKQIAYKALSEAYAQLGDFKSSLAMFKRAAELHDTVYSIASAEKIAALETAQREQEIRYLQSEKAREHALRYSLLAGVVVLCVFLIVLVQFNRRRKRDNLELQKLNAKLFDANEELSLLSAEKDEILNIVTHGLKSQLFGVRSLAESMIPTLDNATTPNAAPLAEMSRSISRASTQMFSLVTNLLTVNAAEHGLLKPVLAKTDVRAVVKKVCEGYKEIAAVKNISLICEVSENEELFANADEQMLHEIVENLVSNAVKFSPKGRNVFLRLQSRFNILRVEVEDAGPGIVPADMKKLFGKFQRLSARPTGGEHSTGLGLSIVKKMVEAMNGKVWCESELDKGATFIVELPRS